MCFRPAALDNGGPAKCPKCGAVVLPTMQDCPKCGARAAVGAPGMPSVPGAPGAPKAPGAPGAPGVR